jgi:hypothetical protein
VGDDRERGRRPGAAGGITGGVEITTAAALALHGLPAIRFLTTPDPEERLVLIALAKRCVELRAVEQRNLAVQIVNTLGKALKRG